MQEYRMFHPFGDASATEQWNSSKMMSPFPAETPIGMAYIPFQQGIQGMYNSEKGLDTGTIFPDLNKPFLGRSLK